MRRPVFFIPVEIVVHGHHCLIFGFATTAFAREATVVGFMIVRYVIFVDNAVADEIVPVAMVQLKKTDCHKSSLGQTGLRVANFGLVDAGRQFQSLQRTNSDDVFSP